jgi:hypothetical protein
MIPQEIETIARRLLADKPAEAALLLRIGSRVRDIMRALDTEPVVVAFPDQRLRVV